MKKINIVSIICLLGLVMLRCGTDKNVTHVEFEVLGNCDMCKKDIDGALKNVDGIKTAEWDVDTKMMKVYYDSTKISEHLINTKIAEAGHDTKSVKATEESYKKLPECCQYKRTM